MGADLYLYDAQRCPLRHREDLTHVVVVKDVLYGPYTEAEATGLRQRLLRTKGLTKVKIKKLRST